MRLIPAAILSLLGFTVLVALGIWQVQRLHWKEGLLAEMESRLLETPAALPAVPDPERDRFRAVRIQGTIEGQGVAVFGTWRGAGAGYRIISPFRTDDGRDILVDRGIAAAPEARDLVPRDRVAIEGNLDWPEGADGTARGLEDIWLSRSIGPLSRALDTEQVMLVVRATSDPSTAIAPVPMDTAGIPNNHLGYAIQWFGLALVWAGMAGYWFWRAARREEV